MNRFNSPGLAAVIALAVSMVPAVSADELTGEQAQEAAETRQAIFKLLAWNMDPMGDMLRNQRPFDIERVERSATRIAQLGAMIPDAFERDTREFALATQARDGIWSNADDFAARAGDLVEAAEALRAAAEGGEQPSVLQAIGALGQACGACHDAYRDQ